MSTLVLSGKGVCQRAHDDGRMLLQDIDFQLMAGARVAISGASGAGKSVFLRTISLLDLPAAGTLYRYNQPVRLNARCIAQHRSQIAYVRQQAMLIPGTVRDNLRLPFTLRFYQQEQFQPDYVQQVLQNLGKDENFLERDATDLSGGEAQLVCLLRILQLKPPVLLLDEPTASLDEDSARAVQKLVNQWQQDNPEAAYMWISHSEQQVMEVGDEIWYLDAGRITHTRKSAQAGR
ncbi:MAG: ATP-binding cassette domain-containing protein [Snodgrassella sp.]|uniref:ABC transporter ATP-binding protein n=1 Tax=Snodgrassella sp. TaxID=2815304 RepID=UPI00258ED671|nr:ATP-binding cassette domain-containing protein [Snodgrassella sp.]MCO6523229.1 ATP-binding cassette domain-containing protein [Snodgrassella sp.]